MQINGLLLEVHECAYRTHTHSKHRIMYLIENGEVYAPESCGVRSILCINEKITAIGELDRALLTRALPDLIPIDASGCFIVPGLIDPHEHLIGAAGEDGFASRTYCVPMQNMLHAGITSVVGCMGTDTTSRSLLNLLGRVKQLREMGLNAYMLSGGFQLPTPTITRIVLDDLVVIEEIIGVGEISIADERAVEPDFHELTKLVIDASVGGKMAGKHGYTHFHTGKLPKYLSILHKMIDEYPHLAEHIYPTHITRSEELMKDAIKLSNRGSYVDIDCTETGLGRWICYYLDNGSDASRLTVSSDAHTSTGDCEKYYTEFKECLRSHDLTLDQLLPFFTTNPARVMGLKSKGEIRQHYDADLTLIDKETLEVKHVFSRARHMLKDGEVIVKIKDKTLNA